MNQYKWIILTTLFVENAKEIMFTLFVHICCVNIP